MKLEETVKENKRRRRKAEAKLEACLREIEEEKATSKVRVMFWRWG